MGTIIKRPDIKGDIVHVANDRYGNILVIDDRKHRILSFDSVFEQSKILRRAPHVPVHEYSRAMLLPIAFARPDHITVLGLGAGVVAHGIHRLLPDSQVHVVELRQKVFETARDWFSFPQHERLHVTVADAWHTLEHVSDSDCCVDGLGGKPPLWLRRVGTCLRVLRWRGHVRSWRRLGPT